MPAPRRPSQWSANPKAAARYRECMRLLYAGTTLTPEQAAAFEKAAKAAPYRKHPQGELRLEPSS